MYSYRPDPEDLDRYPNYSPLGTAIDRILHDNDYRPVTDPEEALAIIVGAKANNTPDVIRALHAVGGPIRKLRKAARTLPREDFDSAVTMVLAEALKEFDPEVDEPSFARLGKKVYSRGMNEVAECRSRAVAVPRVTLCRYFRIDREARAQALAEGKEDHTFIALALARDYGMKPETFMAVRDAVETVPTSELPTDAEVAQGVHESDVLDKLMFRIDPAFAEDYKELVYLAFAAVDPDEARVVAVAYGFDEVFAECDGNACSDAEVGERLKMTRITAYRTRTRALAKMRDALLNER